MKVTNLPGWSDDNVDCVSELKNVDDVAAVVDDGPDRIGITWSLPFPRVK